MHYEVFPAVEKDLEQIYRITRLFDDDGDYSRGFLHEKILGGRVFVAKRHGTVAGYLLYQMMWGHIPFLALINVLPEYQSQGVGRSLLAAFEQHLRTQGFREYVSSTEKGNTAGQRFHERNGFRVLGQLEIDASGDELFYAKRLTPQRMPRMAPPSTAKLPPVV